MTATTPAVIEVVDATDQPVEGAEITVEPSTCVDPTGSNFIGIAADTPSTPRPHGPTTTGTDGTTAN